MPSAPAPARVPPSEAPEALLARLEASGLRGRGGGWFPAARKWRAVRAEGGRPLVVANGAEGEPGSVKDRQLLRTRSADILAGLALAARAVGAAEAVVFLKGAFGREAEAVHAALAATPPPPGLAIRVAHGDDSYIVGEETALLESLEGRRPWPRPKPPLPAAVGFEGRPTLVHNVETLARLPDALADPEAYRTSETTFVSLWGDVQRPGLYEVRLGTPLSRVIEERGGGAPPDRPASPASSPAGPRLRPWAPRSSTRPSIRTRCAPRARRSARGRCWRSRASDSLSTWRCPSPPSSSASPAASARPASGARKACTRWHGLCGPGPREPKT